MFKEYFGMLRSEFKGYSTSKFVKDGMAGVTVAAVALPLALAFGVASGADAAAGLITAIIAGFVIGGLSGGFYQISGPTGAMAAILISIIATYQMQGVFIATFIAGIILLVAGIFKLGKLIMLVPSPVITGFTSGIAIVIALGQIDNFFGVSSEGGSLIEKMGSYGQLGFMPQLGSVLIGLFVILVMVFLPKKINKIIPSSLIAIIAATVIVAVFNIDVPKVGAIPQTLVSENRLTFAGVTPDMLRELAGPALSIAVLGMIESLLCGASAGRMTGKDLKNDQELIAQGIGNIVLPFFGGIPATAAIARSSVAIKSGAVTRLAGIIHAVVLLASMFLLAPVMSGVPLSALSGVLMVTAFRMNEWSSIRYMFKKKWPSAIALFLLTMVATVLLDLNYAIAIGVVIGIVFFLIKNVNIEIDVADVDPVRMGMEGETVRHWAVVYITGPLFFMTEQKLRKTLLGLDDKEMVIFSMRGVPNVDFTAMTALIDFYKKCEEEGREVIFAGVQPSVLASFKKSGLYDLVGEKSIFFSVDKALELLL